MELLTNLDQRLGDLAAQHGAVVYLVLFAIAFSQTGLLLGPAIPGNTVIFATGMLASGADPILGWPLAAGSLFAGGAVGNVANYAQGHKFGRAVFERRETGMISRESLDKTDAFFAKHGRWTMILSPFVPFVRSFAPFIAGVGRMHLPPYLTWGALGVAVWVVAMMLAGSALGQVPWIRENIGLALILIFAIVSAQIGLAIYRKSRAKVTAR